MDILRGNTTALNEIADMAGYEEHGELSGVLEMAIGSYQTNQEIFEASLRRDVFNIYCEANESSAASEEAKKKDGGFIASLWAKIKSMIDAIIKKVNELVSTFQAKMKKFIKERVNKVVAKGKKSFMANNLGNMKVKNFHKWNMNRAENLSASAFANVLKDEANLRAFDGKSVEQVNDMVKNKFNHIDKTIYGKLLGKGSLTPAEFKTALHKAVFNDETTEYPFKDSGLKSEIMHIIEGAANGNGSVAMVAKCRDGLNKDLKQKKAQAIAMEKAARKLSKDDAERAAKIAQAKAVSSLVSTVQRVSATALSAFMAEEKKIVASAFKLFNMGIHYKEKTATGESYITDPVFLDVIGESAYDEAELYLDNPEKDVDLCESVDLMSSIFSEDTQYSFI